jgi:alginate O-acetyltransferase complex protein AlgI
MTAAAIVAAPDARVLLGVALVGGSLLVGGFVAGRIRSAAAAWILASSVLLFTLHLVDREPAWVRMVAIVATMLLGMKAVVASNVTQALTFRQWIAFTLWPGMRPAIFASLGSRPREGARKLARDGAISFAAGATLLMAARELTTRLSPAAARICATPLLLVGLSLMLHFGLLNFLAAWWRTRGVPAERLFRDPLHAASLTDFWSRRWNLAFSEMTAVAIYRPIKRLAGPQLAVFASFVMSGLLHEMAISVPARGGYGLPTLYFALHGFLVSQKIKSRTAMFVALIAPILLVFHLPFLRAIIWPLAGIR